MNKITAAISKIKNPDSIKHGEEILITVRPHAQEYIDAYKKISAEGSTREPTTFEEYLEVDQAIEKKVSLLHFFNWLNDQKEFINLTKNLPTGIKIGQTGTIAYMIANAIVYCADTIPAQQAIVVPKEWKQFVDKYIEPITLMSRNFELQTEELLFNLLIKKLQNSLGNIHNAKKQHPHQMRALFTKQIIRGLCMLACTKNNTNTAIADLSLGIVSVFFEPMTRNEAISLAKSVRKNAEKEKIFLQKTVEDLLNNQSY